jgi:hypothetical protein
MKSKIILLSTIYYLLSTFLMGCVVRTYKITKERIDLDLEGNRGYLIGEPPQLEREPKRTRTINVLEIEIGNPIKIE